MRRSTVHSIGSPVALAVLASLVVGPAFSQDGGTNDDCQNALPITDGSYVGSTAEATVDGFSAGCATGTGPDLWYLYTATCDGFLVVDTCASELDTNLSIQHPDCSGDEIACNEDACGPAGAPWQSMVGAPVQRGEQMLIRVSGWDGSAGPFELNVSCNVMGKRCPDALPLTVPGSAVGGISEWQYEYARNTDRIAQNNRCGFNLKTNQWAGDGVWYEVTGTGTRMTASTCNPDTTISEEATSLAIFCEGCERMVCVDGSSYDTVGEGEACGPGGANISWCSRAGQKYLIWMMDFFGIYELTVRADETPCYDAVDCTPVDVLFAQLSDNGDDDGWADTHETVNVRFAVKNRSDVPLSGLTAHVTSEGSSICVVDEPVYIGDLAGGETALTEGPFTFRVGGIDRQTLGLDEEDELSRAFRIEFSADQFERQNARCSRSGAECPQAGEACPAHDVCEQPRCLVTGKPCTNDESCGWAGNPCVGTCSLEPHVPCFPGGARPELGETAPECGGPDICIDPARRLTLDLDLDATGGSGPGRFFEGFESGDFGQFTSMNLDYGLSTTEGSDRYHCQMQDPDNVYGLIPGADCVLGWDPASANADYWRIDNGRSFSGDYSLHMGLESEPGLYETPAGTIEAIRTTEAVNLGTGAPELSFKHQVRLTDARDFGHQMGARRALDRAVVQVQRVNSEGNPVDADGNPEHWITIEPWLNRYHAQQYPYFWNCTFDPIDDGNDEEDFYDPGNPRFGPSSTCYPQWVFSAVGDTEHPFDATRLGGPLDGPGLRGNTGIGTWLESRFDLRRYRGQRLRFRFLTSGTGGRDGPYWEANGWWIDDITITNVLAEPTTLVPDSNSNNDLVTTDSDGDCVSDVNEDCNTSRGDLWSVPGAVTDLKLDHEGRTGGVTTLVWGPPVPRGGRAEISYFLVTQDSETCAETSVDSRATSHSVDPAPGELYTFLVQAVNPCGPGSLGVDSNQQERDGCASGN